MDGVIFFRDYVYFPPFLPVIFLKNAVALPLKESSRHILPAPANLFPDRVWNHQEILTCFHVKTYARCFLRNVLCPFRQKGRKKWLKVAILAVKRT